MNKNIFFALAGLVIGAVVTGIVVKANYANKVQPMAMQQTSMNGIDMNSGSNSTNMSMQTSMDNMTAGLQGKTGGAFDKEFLAEMIVHHQGAIDMANLALTNANHQEVKDLAKNIVTAQTTEINEMKQWQLSWYGQK
jgi:uncharacterized protein (DUF305 family)